MTLYFIQYDMYKPPDLQQHERKISFYATIQQLADDGQKTGWHT